MPILLGMLLLMAARVRWCLLGGGVAAAAGISAAAAAPVGAGLWKQEVPQGVLVLELMAVQMRCISAAAAADLRQQKVLPLDVLVQLARWEELLPRGRCPFQYLGAAWLCQAASHRPSVLLAGAWGCWIKKALRVSHNCQQGLLVYVEEGCWDAAVLVHQRLLVPERPLEWLLLEVYSAGRPVRHCYSCSVSHATS